MDVRKKIIGSGILGLLLIVAVFISPVLAKKPLYGTMDLTFNLAWPGPQDDVPDWVGTITIDGTVYRMLFFAIGSGKPFANPDVGQVHFFEEIWAIYTMEGTPFPELANGNILDWNNFPPKNDPAELVMWGYDKGLTNKKNSKYHMNGNVEEAFGDFAKWEGRKVYMSGKIIWHAFGPPDQAPGTFRIN